MLTPLVLAALIAPQDLELLHVEGSGDPVGLAQAPDGVAYVALGTRVYHTRPWSLDLLPGHVVEVDGCVVAMDASNDALAIAGGTQGLFVAHPQVDANDPPRVARASHVDQVEGLVCSAVLLDGGKLYAAFSSDDRSELRVYELVNEGPQRVSITEFPGGPARALAVRDDVIYIALFDDWLGRVVFNDSGDGLFERGPDLEQVELPAGAPGPCLVRDLAIDGDHLVVAADACGLLEFDLTSPWGANPRRQHDLHHQRRVVYAARVDAEDGHVVVGTNRASALAADGAPYVATGAFGLDMSVGSEPLERWPAPAGADVLVRYLRRSNGTLKRADRKVLEPSGWRDLLIHDGRVVGLRLKHGLLDWQRDGALREAPAAQAASFPGIDGITSRVEPGLVLFGTDSDHGAVRGVPRVADNRVEPSEAYADVERLGLAPDAQWLSDDGRVEWFIGGYGAAWQVFRHDPRAEPRIVSWPLHPPVDPDGQTGDTYFNAHRSGEWLFLTRARSRFGLLLYSRTALQHAAAATIPGAPLELAPLATVRTHPAEHPGPHFTWRVDSLRSDVRGVPHLDLLVAAGREANGQARSLHARMFPESDTPSIRVASVLTGSAAEGHAMGAALVERGEHAYAFVTGLGGTLDVFDLIDPVTSWSSGPNAFDGHVDALLDIEARVRDDAIQLLVAAGRRGVLRFEFKDRALTLKQELDTPGWCTGVHLFGEHRVLVGDQKAGLRLYVWD